METNKSPFFIGEDKELLLQMLKVNHVPAMEIIDAKDCSYPIIGRKFGHHSGKDIKILHTKEQTEAEECDFFTKLYVFEEEYKLEVLGLQVISCQKIVRHHVQYTEIPIRTETFGWKWGDEEEALPEEMLQLAVRAAYVIGVVHADVKIGRLSNGKAIVIDIHPISLMETEEKEPPCESITMGADIEFMLSCDGELLPASEFFPLEGALGCDERQIERDSGEFALAEIRPEPTESPHELFHHIQQLITEASNLIPYQNISLHAGSMPFYGYQCGGHLHFGLEPSVTLLRVLDYYLSLPLAMLEPSNTSRRRRKTKHGGLGRFRLKPYGFEYLSLSSWIIQPEITLAVLALAKLVVASFARLETTYLFHPLIQRAYYGGNPYVLRSIWPHIKQQIMEKTDYWQLEREVIPLFVAIEEGISLDDSVDIRRNWNIEIPKQAYERGANLYLPKHVREKLHVDVGEDTYVCAGKMMTKAVIHPYPFTFRNPNRIQLSPKLRNSLSLPNHWNPKITAANGALILGPILGILAERPFERQGTYFQHISEIAQEKQMLVYVFAPEDIHWDKQLINGTTLDGQRLLPFPSVIYDRYFRRRKNNRPELEETRAKLEFLYQIPFINSPRLFALTGNKWTSYELLKEELEEYLPVSCLYREPQDIKEMLNQYGEIFIKPLDGSLGKGIIRLKQNDTGLYWLPSQQNVFQPVDEEKIFSQLQSGDFLIQEAVKRK